MKKYFIITGIAFGMMACTQSSNDNEYIKTLKTNKDSLKNIYDDIASQIAAIDEELITLDTTIKFTLVTTNVVEERAFEHYVEVQGAVELGGNALVYPEVPGKVTAIRFKEGNKVKAEVSGSGNLNLRGYATSMEANLSGSGSLTGFNCPMEAAIVKASGSGNCELNVTNTLEALVLGSSTIKHKGNTKTAQKKIYGSGSVVRAY